MSHVSPYLNDCLKRKVLFFTGKGGVGKSSLAWATALACKKAGARVTLASWSAFTETAPPEWLISRGIRWERLETMACFKEYVVKHFKVEPLFNLVFDNRIFRSFVLAAPGLAETIVAGKIWDLVDAREQDLPASGHAVSFFHSTVGVQKIFPMGFVHEQTTKILQLWKSKDCRVDIVSLPEEMPMTESVELKQKLLDVLDMNLGFFVVNRCLPNVNLSQPVVVSSPLELVRAEYTQRSAEEKSLLTTAAETGLPLVTIPSLVEETLEGLILQIESQLEAPPESSLARGTQP
jgi:anion-transporting  ArsA/GET3 family ATPase